MTQTEIKAAKVQGWDFASEILAREGIDFAIAELNKTKSAHAFWAGFADRLVEHRGNHIRDGLAVRPY